jgi:hypothetical protein
MANTSVSGMPDRNKILELLRTKVTFPANRQQILTVLREGGLFQGDVQQGVGEQGGSQQGGGQRGGQQGRGGMEQFEQNIPDKTFQNADEVISVLKY